MSDLTELIAVAHSLMEEEGIDAIKDALALLMAEAELITLLADVRLHNDEECPIARGQMVEIAFEFSECTLVEGSEFIDVSITITSGSKSVIDAIWSQRSNWQLQDVYSGEIFCKPLAMGQRQQADQCVMQLVFVSVLAGHEYRVEANFIVA